MKASVSAYRTATEYRTLSPLASQSRLRSVRDADSLLLGKSGHNGDNHIAHDATRVEERFHEAAPAAAVDVQKSQKAKRRFEASVKP